MSDLDEIKRLIRTALADARSLVAEPAEDLGAELSARYDGRDTRRATMARARCTGLISRSNLRRSLGYDAEDPPVYGPISPCQFWRR